MTSFNKKRVIHALETIGLSRCKEGKGGHELWQDKQGNTVSASFHGKNDIAIAYLYSMGDEMERKGMMTRVQFMQRVKALAR